MFTSQLTTLPQMVNLQMVNMTTDTKFECKAPLQYIIYKEYNFNIKLILKWL